MTQKSEKIYSKKSWHYRLVRWTFDSHFYDEGHVTVGALSYVLRIIISIITLPFILVWAPLCLQTTDDERDTIEWMESAGLIYNTIGILGVVFFGAKASDVLNDNASQLRGHEHLFILDTVMIYITFPIVIAGAVGLVRVLHWAVDNINRPITFNGDSHETAPSSSGKIDAS